MNKKIVFITLILSLLTFFGCQAEVVDPGPYTVRYVIDGVGGSIFGATEQTVAAGEDGLPVSTYANDGFRFVGFYAVNADGTQGELSPDPVHVAEAVQADTTIAVQFVQEYPDIPLIMIETDGKTAVTSREDYLLCNITVSDPEDASNSGTFLGQIRGRGNASWNFPKKSYKIKFGGKINLLDTGDAKAKDWTLISCYGDQSLLRNFAACRMGELLDGIPWSPSCTFAEVYLNGDYLGVYMVSDQVEENEDRVAIDESLTAELERDYFLELDMYAGGEQYIDYFACGGKPWSIKSDVTEEQGKYLFERMQAVDDAINSGDEAAISAVVDMDSLVDTYLLQEYSKNIDVGWSSLYIVMQADGKLVFTAPWDFDLAFGNDQRLDNGSAKDLYAATGRSGFGQNNLWFMRLWKLDWFKTRVADRYAELGPILETLRTEVAAWAEAIAPAMARNYDKWDVLTARTHQQPNAVLSCKTYDAHIAYLIDWMQAREDILTEAFAPYRSIE